MSESGIKEFYPFAELLIEFIHFTKGDNLWIFD